MARSDSTSLRDATPIPGRRVGDSGAVALTEIEHKILDFMVQYLRANTYQPSIREIGQRFGIKSTKTVSEHLQTLADKGYLERDPSRSRGVKILGVDLSNQTVSIPCFSQIPQGKGDKAEFSLSIDRRLAGDRGGFFVRAGSADLAVLGIQEGDYVLVQPASANEVEDGAVVIASVGNGSRFHRFSRNGSGVHLTSLKVGGETTSIQDEALLQLVGKVTAFYRRMDESGALNLTQH